MKKINISLETEVGTFSAELPIDTGTAHALKLISHGPKKIACIKEIRAFTGLGLKEAKTASECLPYAFERSDLKGVAPSIDLDDFAKALKDIGATVEIDRAANPNLVLASEVVNAFRKAGGLT